MRETGQFFQIATNDSQPIVFSRNLPKTLDVVKNRVVIAPHSFYWLITTDAVLVSGEMSAVLSCFPSIGVFQLYPFFVWNFSLQQPCSFDTQFFNNNDNPVDFYSVVAK